MAVKTWSFPSRRGCAVVACRSSAALAWHTSRSVAIRTYANCPTGSPSYGATRSGWPKCGWMSMRTTFTKRSVAERGGDRLGI
uniref:Putative secreted protein n=1 Tax=Anopheles darlingi TaxID=43151 RepID=A0A2M4DAI4_ANODA